MSINLITGYDINTDECGESRCSSSPAFRVNVNSACIPVGRKQQVLTERMFYNTQS